MKYFKYILISLGVGTLIFSVLFFVFVSSLFKSVNPVSLSSTPFQNNSQIVVLKLEGVILDGGSFLEQLRKYRKKEAIKAIVVQVNSPGGVVGGSQEIYSEIVKTRKVFKKPVVVSFNSMAASGAYYASIGADRIFTNKGTLVGSIGVVIEFMNLKDLHKWAKVKRFSITSGIFKDSGSSYRDMKPYERKYFQSLTNDIFTQFKNDIIQARKLDLKVVNLYSDGRVFTGKKAVELGFVDEVGTLTDAVSYAGTLAGLGKNPDYFFHKERRPFQFLELMQSQSSSLPDFKFLEDLVALKTSGLPLFIFPGVLGGL